MSKRIAVVGAGVAGLVAARALAKSGVELDLIEASARVGGRILSRTVSGWPLPIELGAEFVHGRPKPLSRLIEGTGLELLSLADRHHFPAGDQNQTARGLRELPDFWARVQSLLGHVDASMPDVSAESFATRWSSGAEERALFDSFVAGFHAAPLGDVSIQSLASDSDEDHDAGTSSQFRIEGGYGQLVRWLAGQIGAERSCTLHLQSIVRRVDWKPGHVLLEIQNGQRRRELSARALLLTVPLGVLALSSDIEGGIRFEPEIGSKRALLRHLGMGRVKKLVLCFREKFWDDARAPDWEFIHAPKADFLTYWRESRYGAEQITAWSGGTRAEACSTRSESDLVHGALATLCELLGASRERAMSALTAHHHYGFDFDPFIRGAYSYVRPGGRHAREQLAAPIEQTLFFAGEASDSEYAATVAGAVQSGERAAEQMIAAG